ncbi:Lrp/AsnC family transcriptional regulator [Halorubrum gandharaense]
MSNPDGDDYRLDDIDRRIIHALMDDARNTSAPMVAETVNVSPGTIRNRIDRLEQHGVIRGYTAQVDFARAADKLTYLYVCTVAPAELSAVVREVRSIPGVTNVRELLGGNENLHVTAVGDDSRDHDRIVAALVESGASVVDERLIREEFDEPYTPFGLDEDSPAWEPADFVSLAGGANIVEVTVAEGAPAAGRSLAEAAQTDLLDDEALVVAIERDGVVLTPRGDTVFQPDDVVTLLSRGNELDRTLTAFSEKRSAQSSTHD